MPQSGLLSGAPAGVLTIQAQRKLSVAASPPFQDAACRLPYPRREQQCDMLRIEQATKKDLPAILDLYAQSIDDGVQLPLEKAEEIYARIRSYPSYNIFVARADSGIVGTFALLIMDNLGHLGSPSGSLKM